MLSIIEDLVKKGFAYQVDGDVYFEVSKFPPYGRLSGNRIEDLDAGARIEVREEKRHPADFALWKSDPHHVMKWASRFGPDGFPGWHIECSAMSMKHLGEQIDIHTGGEDNIFPHHECEIAQSEATPGRPFATTWMHSKFLQVDGGKMSKSLGNVYSLDDVVAKGFAPRQLRFCLIRGHYRQPLNFTWDILKESAAALENLDDLALRLRRAAGGQGAAPSADDGLEEVADAKEGFERALDDDLNMPAALGELFKLRTHALEERLGVSAAAQALRFLEKANGVLNVIRLEEESLEDEVQKLIDARQAARKAKDFKESDRIRDLLLARGIVLEDTPKGVVWRKKGTDRRVLLASSVDRPPLASRAPRSASSSRRSPTSTSTSACARSRRRRSRAPRSRGRRPRRGGRGRARARRRAREPDRLGLRRRPDRRVLDREGRRARAREDARDARPSPAGPSRSMLAR
jgi:cysteinyl-tRNA synthetase